MRSGTGRSVWCVGGICVLLLAVGWVQAGTIFVSTAGDDGNSGLSWDDAKPDGSGRAGCCAIG